MFMNNSSNLLSILKQAVAGIIAGASCKIHRTRRILTVFAGRSGRRSGRRRSELRDAEYLIDRERHHAGHEPHNRRLADDPDEFRDHMPSICEQCGGAFPLDAQKDLIGEYDEIEIPPVKPYVIRHRRFACRCAHCGVAAKAPAPAVATTTPFGPRLHALVSRST